MQSDRYTKFILTVIAIFLGILAWPSIERAVVPEAQAQSEQIETMPFGGASVVGCSTSKGYQQCLAVISGN